MTEQYDPRIFAEFFDWQPQPFVWLRPVWDTGDQTIRDFEYTYSNEPGLNYLKLSRDMLGKITVANTPSLADDMRVSVFNEMLRAYTTGQTVAVEMYNSVLDKYGTVYRMKFRGGVLVTIQGKTEEKRAIIELNRRTKELQQFNESLREFAYVASHDLQEPLRKISSFAAMLKEELPELNAAQQNIFNRIESSTLRMKQLIDDLLAYSLVTIREKTLMPVNLQHLVREVLQDLESAIKERGVIISLEALPKINADASQMRQLFQNLIGNAVKYHTKDGTPRVTIRGKVVENADPSIARFGDLEKKSYWLLEVIDNGIGFDQQYEEKIFQAFQRLHGKSVYEGTGIGLAIVQKVVHNHDGFIKAISSPGQGATFQVLLPY